MKKLLILICALLGLAISIGKVQAADLESFDFIDLLLDLREPGKPLVFDDAVVFTASSAYGKVGIAFAHEGYAKIYRFKKLLVPINETAAFDPESKVPQELLRDSGILFYPYEVPQDLPRLEYRLIIDGLWTADPLNPDNFIDRATGLTVSRAPLPPPIHNKPSYVEGTGRLSLRYRGESGQYITVAGDFNGWDPFMYQLRETEVGYYTLSLPLPPGSWRYTFFQNGRRILDPNNAEKVYARDGSVANITVIR
jgi:hypothetical protein